MASEKQAVIARRIGHLIRDSIEKMPEDVFHTFVRDVEDVLDLTGREVTRAHNDTEEIFES